MTRIQLFGTWGRKPLTVSLCTISAAGTRFLRNQTLSTWLSFRLETCGLMLLPASPANCPTSGGQQVGPNLESPWKCITQTRSEERRVGKEGRARGAADH